MAQLFTNNATTRLAADCGAAATSFTVMTGEGSLFPSPVADLDHFLVTLENSSGDKEIVCVVARSGDTFTIGVPGSAAASISGRGQEGTTIRGFSTSDLVELRLTAGFIDAIKRGTITYVIDGGGAVIEAGLKGFIEVPFGGSIKSVRTFADLAGNIAIDIFKDTYSNYNPDSNPTDSICANSTNPITLASVIKAQDETLLGWNRTFEEGDIFYFEVMAAPAPTNMTRLTISITVDRN